MCQNLLQLNADRTEVMISSHLDSKSKRNPEKMFMYSSSVVWIIVMSCAQVQKAIRQLQLTTSHWTTVYTGFLSIKRKLFIYISDIASLWRLNSLGPKYIRPLLASCYVSRPAGHLVYPVSSARTKQSEAAFNHSLCGTNFPNTQHLLKLSHSFKWLETVI